MAFTIFINIVPPSQPDQEPSRDVFNCPEVDRQEDDNNNKASNKTVAEPTT